MRASHQVIARRVSCPKCHQFFRVSEHNSREESGHFPPTFSQLAQAWSLGLHPPPGITAIELARWIQSAIDRLEERGELGSDRTPKDEGESPRPR